MSTTRTKIWVGIGASVFLGASSAAWASGDEEAVGSSDAQQMESAGEGGEGHGSHHGGEPGEGGESGAHHGDESGEGGESGAHHGGESGEGGEGGEGGGNSAFSVFDYLSADAGGEGGEGGESGSSYSSTNPGVYVTTLALMEGHLRVASELYREGAKDNALAHFYHPVAEYYTSLEAGLDARGVEGLKPVLLKVAEEASKGGDWSDLEGDYEAARKAIHDAQAAIDPSLKQDATFQSRVLLALTNTALDEYIEAIDGEQFVNGPEYQDGHGFMLVGRDMLSAQEASLSAADGPAYPEVVEAYEDMMTAWPSAAVPDTPAVSFGELSGDAFALEVLLKDY
ncbi:MAG: hypothetical protein WCD50_07495 [Onishia taeanensis]|uniref:hypothetical protein n=1 Tax=Onishia taeanensis TaxID=284577 RepID=UPI003C7A9EAB